MRAIGDHVTKLWIAGIFFLWGAVCPAQAAWEDLVDERYLFAQKVRSTPFDQRLSAAGFFSEEQSVLRRSLTSDQLFRIAKSFRYRSDGEEDVWQSSRQTAMRWSGDCEDKAIWLYHQMRQSGYRNVCLTVGRYRPNGPRLHVWVTYLDENGDIRLMDPAIQNKPWTVDVFARELYKPLFAFNGHNRYRFSPQAI